VAQNRERNAYSTEAKLEKHRIETAAGKRGQFPAQRKTSEMSLHLSHSLPTFRLNFSDDDCNEYRLRQGYVEFRPNHGFWRILGEDDVQLHCVLHTQIANWLKSHLATGNSIGITPGNN
jgi:hypothetical protein